MAEEIKKTPFKAFQFIVGTGQAGENFASAFEDQLSYYAIALNFNRDTDRVGEHTKIIEKGGTGRKKEIGRKWYVEHSAEIEDFVNGHISKAEELNKQKVKDVLIVCGESGGAGSSISEELRKYLFAKGYNIFQMSILPSQDEGVYFREESLKGLKNLRIELKEGKLKGVFLISNEYVSKQSGITLPPNAEFNNYIVNQFKEIVSCINNNEYDFSDSHKWPDFGDFHTVMHLPPEIFKENGETKAFFDIVAGEFKDDKVTFSSKYLDSLDITSAKAYFGILKLPDSKRGDKAFINKAFSSLDKITKNAMPFKITHYDSSIQEPQMHVLITGCNISKKLIKEIDDISKTKAKFQEKIGQNNTTEDDIFSKI